MTKHELTREEVAELIEGFVDGGGGAWDWDDFTSGMTFKDDRLREIQARCAQLWIEFPPSVQTSYTNAEGIKVLRDYVRELRAPDSR
jgi:hypothetical protein